MEKLARTYCWWIILGLHFLASPLSAQQPISFDDSLETAIQKSVAYFQAQGHSIVPDAYLLYHFMHRKFGIPAPFPEAEFLAQLNAPDSNVEGITPYLRMLRRTKFKRAFLQPTGRLDDITLAGIWYDRLSPKSELERRIVAMDFNDDYNVTHAYLALVLAATHFKARIDPELSARIMKRMWEIALPEAGPWCDVQIEAVALLLFGDQVTAGDQILLEGQPHPIERAIHAILHQQGPDGSWEDCNTDHARETQHTSILALWALLEFKYGDSREAPFLQLR